MNKKFLIVFVSGLIGFYALLHGTSLYLTHRQEAIALKQTTAIQQNIKERFRLFLDLPLSIGLAGADYFSTGNLMSKEYGPHADDLLAINKEILALNIVDTQGKIVRAFPESENNNVIGKVSQNFDMFNKHYQNGKQFWLSAPFNLYQGGMGFVFYVPIIQNKKLLGWFAPVLTSKLFFEKFKLSEFLKSYDLIIKDKESNLDYFASALLPESNPRIYESEVTIMKRPVLFLMWKKETDQFLNIPWYMILAAAGVLSILLVFVVWLHEARKKARHQLEDISILLKLTSKDALNKLIDDQASTADKNNYLNDLLEQIDLLQTMAHTGDTPDQEEQELIPVMRELLQNLDEIISKKSLIISFNEKSFQNGKVFANKWLLQNCIICNALVHSIFHARPESTIVIANEIDDEINCISIHCSKVTSSEEPFQMDRRLEVSRRVAAIYQGSFSLQKDLGEGMIIRIKLPVA